MQNAKRGSEDQLFKFIRGNKRNSGFAFQLNPLRKAEGGGFDLSKRHEAEEGEAAGRDTDKKEGESAVAEGEGADKPEGDSAPATA